MAQFAHNALAEPTTSRAGRVRGFGIERLAPQRGAAQFAVGARVRLANIWNWPPGDVIERDPARVHVRWDNGLQEITTADQLCLDTN